MLNRIRSDHFHCGIVLSGFWFHAARLFEIASATVEVERTLKRRGD